MAVSRAGQVLWRILAFFSPIGFFLIPAMTPAETGQRPSVEGICVRPAQDQPAYLFCRATAWLNALEKAELWIPASAERQLWEMDLNLDTARLALAALLYPVSVSTPDISASPEVRVFLDWQAENDSAAILSNPEKFLIEISLIEEMRVILNEMRGNWTAALMGGEDSPSKQEELAGALDLLWQLAAQKETVDLARLDFFSSDFSRLASSSSLPSMILLARARSALDAHMPQEAQTLAEKAFAICEKRLSDPRANRQAWSLLLAWCCYLRGLAHWQLNQNALARNDLDKAINLTRKAGKHLPLLSELVLARAKFMRQRGPGPEVCRDLEEACALGSCSELAAARRQGECGKGENSQ